MSESQSAKITVGALLTEVKAAFADSSTLSTSFLTDAYNQVAAALALQNPAADAKMTVTAQNGRIATAIIPAQYRRVFCGDAECLRGTATLCALLPDFPIYAPDEDGGAAVTGSGDYTVYYRALPAAVTAETADTTPIPAGVSALPYLRARLFACAYRHIGNRDAAAACDADAETALAALRAECGVRT